MGRKDTAIPGYSWQVAANSLNTRTFSPGEGEEESKGGIYGRFIYLVTDVEGGGGGGGGGKRGKRPVRKFIVLFISLVASFIEFYLLEERGGARGIFDFGENTRGYCTLPLSFFFLSKKYTRSLGLRFDSIFPPTIYYYAYYATLFPRARSSFLKERKKENNNIRGKNEISLCDLIYLSIYLSTIRTNCDTKLQISSQIRHFRHRVARTSSFPPLLINHTSIRLVNPGIPTPLHTPRLCFIYHLYRVIIVGRYRGSTAEFCPLSP